MAVLLMSTTIKIKKSQTIETGIRERKFLTVQNENAKLCAHTKQNDGWIEIVVYLTSGHSECNTVVGHIALTAKTRSNYKNKKIDPKNLKIAGTSVVGS